MSPIVSAEIGNAVGHGFDFRNENLNLLVVVLLVWFSVAVVAISTAG